MVVCSRSLAEGMLQAARIATAVDVWPFLALMCSAGGAVLQDNTAVSVERRTERLSIRSQYLCAVDTVEIGHTVIVHSVAAPCRIHRVTHTAGTAAFAVFVSQASVALGCTAEHWFAWQMPRHTVHPVGIHMLAVVHVRLGSQTLACLEDPAGT